MFTVRFDMRAPEGGAEGPELYAAALDIAEWAEKHGSAAAVVCEHHASEDGYLPAPLMLAAAMAARTSTLAINVITILPLYDPVRLSEDIAVLDILSRGRASHTMVLGYREEEYRHFDRSFADRGRIADTQLRLVLDLLTTGEAVRDGAPVRLSPRPATPGGPLVMWGGGSVAAARRAGRFGLGLLAQTNVEGMEEAHRQTSIEHGHEPAFALLPAKESPTVTFVAQDVDAAWSELGPYLLHDARSYASWNVGNTTSAGISTEESVEELRATSHSHKVFTVDEAVERIRGGEMLTLSPLCGGLPPELAWRYLDVVATRVLPALSG